MTSFTDAAPPFLVHVEDKSENKGSVESKRQEERDTDRATTETQKTISRTKIVDCVFFSHYQIRALKVIMFVSLERQVS